MPIEKTRTQSRKLRRQIQRIEIRRPGCRLVRLAHVDFELKLETVGVDPDRVRLVRELHLLDGEEPIPPAVTIVGDDDRLDAVHVVASGSCVGGEVDGNGVWWGLCV